jgi:S-adenosylmethionine decarboxylase proenzyme
MVFKAKAEGYEVTAIFNGVSSEKINDCNFLKEISTKLLKAAGFTVLGFNEHKFSPQGYTLVVLLAESHFAVHTYPEYSTIYFHLYSCGEKDEKIIFSELKKMLGPKKAVFKKKIVRVKF